VNELTERQQQIAELVARGLQVAEIAEHLSLAEQTVKNHKRRIYRKLGVRNAVEMTRLLQEAA
jgi:DNA-binding NarL/FixJ family response regulator